MIFASNQSHTSLRERPRKAAGHEAIGGEDPLVIVAISLVSTMTSQSDACVAKFGELNSERYSSVHSKRRFRVCRTKKITLYSDKAGDFLWLTVAGISTVQNTGHRVLPMVAGSGSSCGSLCIQPCSFSKFQGSNFTNTQKVTVLSLLYI